MRLTHSPSPALRGWHQYLELKLVSLTGRADILYFSWGMKLLPPPHQLFLRQWGWQESSGRQEAILGSGTVCVGVWKHEELQ